MKTTPDISHLERRAEELRQALRGADPVVLARRAGASYHPAKTGEGGKFRLALWGAELALSFPDFNPQERVLSPSTLALLLYYFTRADGTPLAGRWISFSELPDGRFYDQAFQGYSGGLLGRVFGDDLGAFGRAASRLGGASPSGPSLGQVAFVFQALPRVPLFAAAWQGDEDFPTSYQVLFDASASHYLPTDACAILGGTLARKLVDTL